MNSSENINKKTTLKIKWKPDTPRHSVLHEKNGVTWLTFQKLDHIPGILHAFSTRLGGVSEGYYASMNLSFTQQDPKENVDENYRLFCEAIGVRREDLVRAHQTHTANVRVMTRADSGKGIVLPQDYQDVDGMVTDVPGLMLATTYADCVPLYLVDPVKRAVGLSHSGWRGTVQKIGKKTADLMTDTYGTDPKDLIAVIGPSICQDCYEVSEDVILEFRKEFKEQAFLRLFSENGDGKYQLNLQEANREIFMEAGIPEDHIVLPDICTCCNPQFLFSHRASKGKRGLLGAFLGIRA